ncbi:2700_t:CDS:1, partial [Entrophospora sp. SA101]
MTDHASLEFIKSQANLSRRQARWLELLQSIDFEVKYRPGKTNVVADALSRLSHLANVSVISTQLDNHVNWKEAYLNDKYFGLIWNILNNSENSDAKQQARAKYFELQN